MGERGDLWHRAILDPALLRVVGPVRGLRILDLGCGNGYLTRRWARAKAAESVGVDSSSASLAFARRRERRQRSGARFVRQEGARLDRFESGRFDLVVAHMSLMDIEDARGTIREAARVLRPGGRLVFSINHPCFEVDLDSAWQVERRGYETTVYRKVSRYRTERAVRVPWKVSERETAYTRGYHRPLPTYFRYLRESGLAVVRLEEPFPLPEAVRKSDQGRFLTEIPLHLLVEAIPLRKVPPRPPRRTSVKPPGSRRSGRTRGPAAPRSGSRGRRRGSGSARRGSTPGS
jgi:SAM-dependent methyltransferase